MHSAEMMPRNSTTSVSRFDAYWLPACCPSFFFTDRYTGRNAVTRMPPTTISYSRRPDSGGGVFRFVFWLRDAGQRAIGARVLADDGKLRGRSGKRRPLGA